MHKKIVIFITGIIATIIFLFFTWDTPFKYFGALIRINHIFYDTNLKIFHKKIKSDNIVIIDIDEKSLQYEGRWPWPRNKVASLVKNLQNSNTAVIALDILFAEPEPNIVDVLLNYTKENNYTQNKITDFLSQQSAYFDNDKTFAETIAKSDVVLGVFFGNALYHSAGKIGRPIISIAKPTELTILKTSKFIGNTPVLADAAPYTGFTTIMPDEDGYIRRAPLLIEYNQELYPSLALEIAKVYLLTKNFSLDLHDVKDGKIFLGVNLGDIYIPTDLAGNILVSYGGPAFSFRYLSATDILHNNFNKQDLNGKIAIIGSSAIGIGDLHSTPLQAVNYPGMEIQATIVSSILNKNIISSPMWLVGVERILMALISLIVTILAIYLPALGLFLLIISMLILIFIFNAMLLVKWGLISPHLVLPYLQVLFLGIVNSIYGYLFETRYREKLHNIYGQYVSSEHIDKMLEFPDQYTLAGNTKMMTVLFADIKSFTSIAEKLDAKEVKKFLNALFTPLTAIIFEYKGTIDKYVGDMIMAFWNDPIDDPQHAAHGVHAAIMMQSKVKELSAVFAEQNLNNVGIRIGINTGMMHVGDMGSKYRKAYTVLGDAVNLASRLEGVNKIYKTDILVSQQTKDMCNDIIFRFIDCIHVKGKDLPTNIYEPLCLLNNNTNSLDTELKQYNKALELYNANNWNSAKKEFEKLTLQYPQTEIYAIYLKRIIGINDSINSNRLNHENNL